MPDQSSTVIVTQDDGFARALGSPMRAALGTPALKGSGTLGADFLRALPREAPLVVLDLRRSSPVLNLWRTLLSEEGALFREAASGLRLVGVFDDTIPLDEVARTAQLLADTWSWPSVPHASAIVRAVERPCWGERTTEFAVGRELSGRSCRFQTWTDEVARSLERLRLVAGRDYAVLLIGETGTGKTTLANLVHELSPRGRHRFLPVACGALTEDLLDSELFGHVRGSFTGADRDKEGKFAAAGEGTLLLDEVDVLGLRQQAKLLRVLESGQYERVGCNETRTSKCRVVAASNVTLEALIERREFRADLFYRLNQIKFELPPLRARPLDTVALAVQFLVDSAAQDGVELSRLHPEALAAVRAYDWPGNTRELRNEMRAAVIFTQGGELTPDLLSDPVRGAWSGSPRRPGVSSTAPSAAILAPVVEAALAPLTEPVTVAEGPSAAGGALAEEIAQSERDAIERMLRKQDFNRAATARALGISRVTLYNKIRKYNIDLDDGE